jgi:RNA polymerase sigma-70 factor, ECF subfamily
MFLERCPEGCLLTECPSITRLLIDWSNGSSTALDELTPHIYRELHGLARMYLRRNRRNQTLQATVLINEVYLRLIDRPPAIAWEGRSQFFGVTARLMRHVLVDHARNRHALKRGGDAVPVTLEETMALSQHHAPDILEVHDALCRLDRIDRRKARIIELRYFGGLTNDEIASVTGVAAATVKRDLRLGEAWLRRELGGHG